MQLKVKDFDLKKTIECGQFFRYELIDGKYYLAHRDNLLVVEQQKDKLIFKGATEKFIKSFFRLNDPYKEIISTISTDKHMNQAVEKSFGLRIIRQDPWECLISYICSQNSNIPRIRKKVNCIAKTFGKKTSLGSFQNYTFPNPGELNNFEKIKTCKVGYRAKYIHKANNINEHELMDLRKKDYNEAMKYLQNLFGVGEKVADCVCMFSLDKLNAFPVDVWIKRVMQELYFNNKIVSNKQIKELANNKFGKYAAYANQFLYFSRRKLV
ncbi:MAG: Endonuclease III [Candidatus Woesearchaeota archaeon]|nr:Endonuclease III [Candidatus Woesearchaeota archaeon]